MTVMEYPSLSIIFVKFLEPGSNDWIECNAYRNRGPNNRNVWDVAWWEDCFLVEAEGISSSIVYKLIGGGLYGETNIMTLRIINEVNGTEAYFELPAIDGSVHLSIQQSPLPVLEPNNAAGTSNTKRLVARGKKGADPYEIKGNELVSREETESLAARDDGDASFWTLDAKHICAEHSCSYIFKVLEENGKGINWSSCTIAVRADDHPDARRKPWNDEKCKNIGNRTPETETYVVDGEYDVDGHPLVVTVTNTEKKLVADFKFTAEQFEKLPARMAVYGFMPSRVKVKAEPRPLDNPKTKRLVSSEETKGLVAKDSNAHTWTLGTRTLCLHKSCIYAFDIYQGDNPNKYRCNIHLVTESDNVDIKLLPWSSLKCKPNRESTATPEQKAYVTTGTFDGNAVTITLSNEVSGLVADFTYPSAKGLQADLWYFKVNKVTSETRPLEAPKAKKLATMGDDPEGLARRRGTRSLEVRGDGVGEENEATSGHQKWQLNGGLSRSCDGNTCTYRTWIARPNDVGVLDHKRCTFTVTATEDNAAIDEPFNKVRCDEPDAQEYLIWGSPPVLEGEIASGLVLKIFLADNVQGWIVVFAVYPDAMYTGTDYSNSGPYGTAIPWGGDTSNIPPAEGEVPAEGDAPAEAETLPEGTEGTVEGTPEAPAKRAAKRDSEAGNKPEWRLHYVWRGEFL